MYIFARTVTLSFERTAFYRLKATPRPSPPGHPSTQKAGQKQPVTGLCMLKGQLAAKHLNISPPSLISLKTHTKSSFWKRLKLINVLYDWSPEAADSGHNQKVQQPSPDTRSGDEVYTTRQTNVHCADLRCVDELAVSKSLKRRDIYVNFLSIWQSDKNQVAGKYAAEQPPESRKQTHDIDMIVITMTQAVCWQ